MGYHRQHYLYTSIQVCLEVSPLRFVLDTLISTIQPENFLICQSGQSLQTVDYEARSMFTYLPNLASLPSFRASCCINHGPPIFNKRKINLHSHYCAQHLLMSSGRLEHDPNLKIILTATERSTFRNTYTICNYTQPQRKKRKEKEL
jgi:hypothetical protein